MSKTLFAYNSQLWEKNLCIHAVRRNEGVEKKKKKKGKKSIYSRYNTWNEVDTWYSSHGDIVGIYLA